MVHLTKVMSLFATHTKDIHMAKRIISTVKNSYGNTVKLRKGETLRGDGILIYRYTDSTGARRTVSSSTIEGLRAKEEQVKLDSAKGLKSNAKTKTLDTVYDEWLSLKRQSGELRDHTQANYTWLYDHYVRGDFGKSRIARITQGDIKRLYNTLHDVRCLAITTIDGLQTVLRQVFEYAYQERYIDRNPTVDAIKQLKKAHNTGEQKHKALTMQEQERFLSFIKNHPTYSHWYPTFAVMVNTGMRVGELTGLRWCDCQNDVIDVNHTLVYYKDSEADTMCWQINDPKTLSGKRTITMFDSVKDALEMEREYQLANKIRSKTQIDGYTDFVFVNRFGNNQHQGTLNRALKRIIRDANYDALQKDDGTVLLPKFSCHNLRTTFCTRLAENGVALKVAMKLMGHNDSRVTTEVYTSVCPDWEKRELADVEKALKSFNI